MTSGLPTTRGRLSELAVVFLRLGILGFGGPAAHIAMMRDEVVRRRRWMTDQMFLDLVGATNVIPGPNSTEMAIHIGYARAGWRGLLVAGGCFIVPAMVIVIAFAWGYTRYGTVPAAVRLLYGIKPVIIAVIAQALWSLGRTAVRGWLTAATGAVALGLFFAGVNELLLLAAGGLAVMLVANASKLRGAAAGFVSAATWTPAAAILHPRTVCLQHAGARVPEDWIGALRQRLRAAGVLARGLRAAPGMADRPATPGRGRGRPVYARSGLHHRHVHRIPAGRSAGRRRGDSRHLPPRVRVRCRQPSVHPPPAPVAVGRGAARWGQRDVPGVDGRRDLATGTRRGHRCNHGRTCGRLGRTADQVPRELSLARGRGSSDRRRAIVGAMIRLTALRSPD